MRCMDGKCWSSNSSFLISGAGWGLEAFDLGEDRSGFIFERLLHAGVVHVGDFARLVFEVQIAKVFVNRFFALAQECSTSLFRTHAQGMRDVEDIKESSQGENATNQQGHRSVSLRACSRRRRSSSGLRPEVAVATGA